MKKVSGGEKPEQNKPIKAPSKIPQKQGWKTFFEVVLMMGWAMLILIGTQLLLGFLASRIFPLEALYSTFGNVIFSVVSYLLAIFLIIWTPNKIPKVRDFAKSTRERLGLKGLPTWTDIGLAPVGYIVTIVLTMGLTAIFSSFEWFNASEAQNLGYNFYMQGWERGVAFVELVIIAPMAEELIFRGWLYGNLRVRVPKVLAILLVSVVFGLIHMQWNVGITVFVMSVVACGLREITGSIYAGTLMHMINNGVAFYLVYIAGMSI